MKQSHIITIANTKIFNENKQIWNQKQICRRAAGQPGAAVKCGHGCPLLPPWGKISSLLEVKPSGDSCEYGSPWGKISSLLEVKLPTPFVQSGPKVWLGGWVWWVRKGDVGSVVGGSVDRGCHRLPEKSPHKKWRNIVHLKTPNYPLSLVPPQIFQRNSSRRNRYFQNENRFFNPKPIQESSSAPGSSIFDVYVNILFSIGSKKH